jgi:hypothetical protein
LGRDASSLAFFEFSNIIMYVSHVGGVLNKSYEILRTQDEKHGLRHNSDAGIMINMSHENQIQYTVSLSALRKLM